MKSIQRIFTAIVCLISATAFSQVVTYTPNNVTANDSITITIGITLATTDVVTVTASTTTVSFNLFGSELT